MDVSVRRGNSTARAWAVVASMSLAAWVIGYFVWAQAPMYVEPGSTAQGQSVIAPLVVMERIAQQLREADLFQNPGGLRSVEAVLKSILWAIGITVLGYGVVRRMQLLALELSERISFSFLTGLLLVGSLTVLWGLAGGLGPLPLLVLQGILSSVFLMELLYLYSDFKQARREARGVADVDGAQRSSWLLVTLRLVAVLFLGALFLNCCTPPVQSDAMRYHLSVPQEWMKLGRITYLPLNAFSNFPALVEIQALLVSLRGLAMVHFALMLATGLAVYGMALRMARLSGQGQSRGLATVAALLYMFTPAGAVVSTWPNIDHATSLCVLLSTLALLIVIERPTWASYAMLGITAGAALSVKYTLLAHMGLLGIVWIVWALRRPQQAEVLHSGPNVRTLPRQLVGAGMAVLIAVLAASPWYIKNVMFTGNPVYPFASGIFKGGEWTPECAQLYASQASRKGEAKTVLNLLASPVRSTFDWMKYETHNPGAMTGIAWLTGIFTAVIAVRRRIGVLVVILFLAGGYWVTWFYSYQSNRMLLPFYALILPCFPCVVAPIAAPLRKALAGLLAAAAFAGVFWAIQWSYVLSALSPPPLPYLLGGTAEQVYLAKSLSYWRAFETLNGSVKKDEKVLLVGEHRIYGAKFNGMWSDWYDTPAIAQWMRCHQVKSFNQLLESLRVEKVNYVVINESELKLQPELFRPRFSDKEWEFVSQLRTLDDARIQRRVIPPGVTILQLMKDPWVTP